MEILELPQLFADKNFPVSLWQMAAIVILYIWFIFSGRFKWGVVLSYFLAMYWIFGSANRGFWIDFFGGQFVGIFSYAVVCLIMVSVGVAGFFRESH